MYRNIVVEINNKCNNKCISCLSAIKQNDTCEIIPEHLVRVMTQILKPPICAQDVVQISGGEPS